MPPSKTYTTQILSGLFALSLGACADPERPKTSDADLGTGANHPTSDDTDDIEADDSSNSDQPGKTPREQLDGSRPDDAGSKRPAPDGGAALDAPRMLVDAGAAGMVPAPPPYAIYVPEYKQPDGDPAQGYDYLVNGEYMRQGPNLFGVLTSQGNLGPEDLLPGRKGDNVGLNYMFNAATADSGNRVAAMTCLSCHATKLMGKLVMGLGHPNRMASTDYINVAGIALANPLALGDSLETLRKLLGGVGYGIIDLLPYFAAQHEPKTLAWSAGNSFPPNADVVGWVDIPPWWRVKKKHGVYSNGVGRGDHRGHLTFATLISVSTIAEATEIEKNFAHVGQYMKTIEPPKFPGKINQDLATQGEAIFFENCATCHGTYGENWSYPNLIIPYKEVGTDPSLAVGHWMKPAIKWYAESWYARNKDSFLEHVDGYYAPPLDGVWASAPFFHNGSVPTLDGVIDPKKRPDTWTSNMSEDDFDLERVGWMDKPLDIDLAVDLGFGRYECGIEGGSNKGHNYGAHLDAAQQKALLEYLKTL